MNFCNGSIGLFLFAAFAAKPTCAQEIEPRSYAAAPVRTHFVLTGFIRSEGGILFDPAVPVSDVEATIDSATVGYGTAVSVLGRATSFALAVPYIWGDVSGNVGEGRRAVTRVGLGDMRMRFGVGLVGGEALTAAEILQRKPATMIGASLTVIAPTGEYMPEKFVNISANRWAFKPEVGFSRPFGRWLVEGALGVWLFEDNDEYLVSSVREQDPLATVQINVSYTFRPRLWAAIGGTYFDGGQTRLAGVDANNRQSNSRVGVVFSTPVTAHQSLKLAWSTGTTTRFGGDFDTFGVFWTYAWSTQSNR